MNNSFVTIENLSKSYDGFPVLQNLNLSIGEGKLVGLLGPNGCGKTTLMKIMTGLINDYTGTVSIDGNVPNVYTKSITSFLPEKTYLSENFKALYAIDMFNDYFKDFDKAKALELLKRFNLDPGQRIKAMSKGMQEKLQLLLVVSRQSRLYVLDEPLGGVDAATRDSILDIILGNYAKDSTVLLSTHMIHDVERIFDDVIMLGFGKVIMHDNVDEIRSKYGKSVDDIFREVFKC